MNPKETLKKPWKDHMKVIESVYSEVPGGRSASAAGNYSTSNQYLIQKQNKPSCFQITVSLLRFISNIIKPNQIQNPIQNCNPKLHISNPFHLNLNQLSMNRFLNWKASPDMLGVNVIQMARMKRGGGLFWHVGSICIFIHLKCISVCTYLCTYTCTCKSV